MIEEAHVSTLTWQSLEGYWDKEGAWHLYEQTHDPTPTPGQCAGAAVNPNLNLDEVSVDPSAQKLLQFIPNDDFIQYILDPHRDDFESTLEKALNKLWGDLEGQKRYFQYSRLKISKEIMEGHEGVTGLVNSQDYIGVIYKVTRYKDEFGRDLVIPEVYIGQAGNVKARWSNEIGDARRGKFGSLNLFLPTIAKHFSEDATCSVDDAFDFEVIDLCYTQKELDLKETFYMDFFDSNNPDYGGLNYYRGPSTWGISPKQVNREELFNALLEGKEFDNLGRDFDVGETTLRKKFGKYIRPLLEHIPDDIHLPAPTINKINLLKTKMAQSSEGTLGIRDAKFALLVLYVGPKLYNLIRSGFTLKESLKWLSDNGITFIESGNVETTRRNLMNERICKRIWGKGYAKCREDFFINPLLEELREQGFDFIIGEGTNRLNPQDVQNLLDRRVSEEFTIGEGSQELGLIERLALSGLKGWAEIAYALSIPDSYTSQGTKRRPSESIRNYVIYRWGEQYRVYNKFVEFLRTHFLGRGND